MIPHPHPHQAMWACGIVRNLAANKINQDTIREHSGAIDVLVELLRVGPHSQTAAKAAAALSNLAVSVSLPHVRSLPQP